MNLTLEDLIKNPLLLDKIRDNKKQEDDKRETEWEVLGEMVEQYPILCPRKVGFNG